jgi:predicted ABC-class ATPase
MEKAGFMGDLWKQKVRRIALQDYLARQFHKAVRKFARGNRGIGKSGIISINSGAQEILERNSVAVTEESVEARFVVGLPAAGRTILGKEAVAIFQDEIPQIVTYSLFCKNLDFKDLKKHIQVAEEQEYLRAGLESKNLVAFVADGSNLARRSGVDDRPMNYRQQPVPFMSPPELRVGMELPGGEKVQGMGIPKGVTLIAGGGFHGKSTLLRALERSVYDHIPGDGREQVVSDFTAVKIRAEDGRYVEKVTIEPFVSNLPLNKNTKRFSTDDASGSTSQAANIIEAVEMDARVFLIDEDTSATNFMIRDERMQELVSKDKEPITPFIDKVRKLYTDFNISTILVMGGSGDYFDVADTVIMMDTYRPLCVTTKAKQIAGRYAVRRTDEGGTAFGEIIQREAMPESFDPSRGKRDVKIDTKGLHTILFGEERIDLGCLEQLVDVSQTRSIGMIIHYMAEQYLRQKAGIDLRSAVGQVMHDIEEKGLDILLPYKSGNLALPRSFEVIAAINRMRTLRVK